MAIPGLIDPATLPSAGRFTRLAILAASFAAVLSLSVVFA